MIRTTLFLLVATGLAAPIAAQETQASAAAKFKREFAASDTNHDGVLEKSEVQARIGRMRVGPGQPDAAHAKRLADLWFASADRNKDGKVTEMEAQALLADTFKRYDANGDGKIGDGERATAERDIRNR